MKKTQLIDLLSTIRNTSVSFFIITLFIALGLAFYGGAAWTAVYTEDSFTQSYQDGKMQTLLVTDSLGLTDEQISDFKTIDGIDDAEGFNIVYRFFENKAGKTQQAAVVQITENISTLMNVEGRLPDSAGETAVLRSWAEENAVSIGDRIELQDENAVDNRELRCVRSIAQWDGKNWDELRISNEDPGYLSENVLTVTAIVDSPVYLSTNPSAHGMCAANGLYIDAVFFVSKQEMPPEAFGGYTSVALISNELNHANSFSAQYKAASHDLSSLVQSRINEWDEQLVNDFSQSVNRFKEQLATLELQNGTASEEVQILYEQLSEMSRELLACNSFSGITEVEDNNSFLTADSLISILSSVRTMLGITFLAIGVLICYSVVSRLVADSAVKIGTLKALGFQRSEILRLYLYYVSSALALGGILGLLLGVFGVEFAFSGIMDAQFTFSHVSLIFKPLEVLPIYLIICGIILGITAIACTNENRKSVIDLLHGVQEEPRQFHFLQTSSLFRKLSLLNQAVIMNLVRDKRRVFGMITGITGAVALITAGLSFYLNFTTAFSLQFQKYYRFDYQICYDSSCESASENIQQLLNNCDLDYAEIYSSSFILYMPDGKTNAPNVIVPVNTDDLANVMYFETEDSHLVPYDDGVWMSEYYQYAYDAPIGSVLSLKTLDGQEGSIAIDHYYKQHLSTPVIVMDAENYAKAFGNTPSPNAFYLSSDGADMQALLDALDGIDGYIYTINFYDSCLASFLSERMFVSAIAILFICIAILMALMTLINLMDVYIAEKKKELIVLMINGYDRKFVKSYIYQDTVVLTLLGILIGLIAGSILGDYTLRAVEGTSIRLIHGVNWISCVLASLTTAGLTALICRHALRKVDGFRLSDIGTAK